MHYFGTPYSDAMRMPVSRRGRMVERENLAREKEQEAIKNGRKRR